MEEKKTSNRVRCRAYTFRVTPEEKKLIDRKIKKSGLSMTEFVIRAIRGKPVIVIEGAGEMLQELKREGNNLNQALRNVYASPGGAFDEAAKRVLMEASANCSFVYKEITDLLKGETHDASL